MRELETSLPQFGEFLLKARLVTERADRCANGLNLDQVSPSEQLIVKGTVLVVAVALDRWRTM